MPGHVSVHGARGVEVRGLQQGLGRLLLRHGAVGAVARTNAQNIAENQIRAVLNSKQLSFYPRCMCVCAFLLGVGGIPVQESRQADGSSALSSFSPAEGLGVGRPRLCWFGAAFREGSEASRGFQGLLGIPPGWVSWDASPCSSPELVPLFTFLLFWGSLCFPPGNKYIFVAGVRFFQPSQVSRAQ